MSVWNRPYIMLLPAPEGRNKDLHQLGMDLCVSGQLEVALRAFNRILCTEPATLATLNNFAVAHMLAGNHQDAYFAIIRAEDLGLVTGPHAWVAWANKALAARELDLVDEAVIASDKAWSIEDNVHTNFVSAMIYMSEGDPDTSLGFYRAVLAEDPDHVIGHNRSFVQIMADGTTEDLVEGQRQYHDAHIPVTVYKNWHKPSLNGKPLRVGYVSGDFSFSSPAAVFSAVVCHHSPAVEVYCYSNRSFQRNTGTDKFMMAAGIQKDDLEGFCKDRFWADYMHRWRDIGGHSDDETCELIRSDNIDVLVSLDGHSGSSALRSSAGTLPIFLRRPALVQVTGWGQAIGTGCPEIDWFFADRVAVPEDEQHLYAEKIAYLPCIATYEPPFEVEMFASSPPPVEANGVFTFGCFCRFEKISDKYLAAVKAILEAVPGSRMLFKDQAFRRPQAVRKVLLYLEGIDRGRIMFVGATGHMESLLSYQQVDLVLDSFPAGGGLVPLELAWMGVPFIALRGKTIIGRIAASVLTCLGMDKPFVVENEQEYFYTAEWFAWAKPARDALAGLRTTLRQRLLDSPICKGYVAAVEDWYRRMVREKAEAHAESAV